MLKVCASISLVSGARLRSPHCSGLRAGGSGSTAARSGGDVRADGRDV